MSEQTQDSKFNPITKWDKEKAFFKTAIVDQKTKQTWPYISSDQVSENRYHNWLAEVTDPITGKPYIGKKRSIDVTEDGVETEKLEDILNYHKITVIQRERTADKREFLVTKGQLIAYNEFGEEKTLPYYKIEQYKETVWNFQRGTDSQGHLKMECLGPRPGADIMHYTVPFTVNNVAKLLEKANENTVQLVVHDVVTDQAQACSSVAMFKTKPFDYLMNQDYMSEDEKKMKLEEEKVKAGISQTSQTRK